MQDAATLVGKKIAELCKEKSISKVCFDRGGFIYHGRIQARLVSRDDCLVLRRVPQHGCSHLRPAQYQ